MCILDENEKFEKGKCAYFKKKLLGERGVLSTFSFFSHTPSGGW
jgi:hypothetical protein